MNGFLVTYGPEPRAWCTSCEVDTRLVARFDGTLRPPDVEQVVREHVCEQPAIPQGLDHEGRAAS